MIARQQMPRQLYSRGSMPPRNKKNFRSTKSGAGMTRAGVKAYRRLKRQGLRGGGLCKRGMNREAIGKNS